MLEAYRQHVEERAQDGVPPKPLNAEQTAALVELLKSPPAGEEEFILDLLTNRIPPGVDEAAYVKAAFLTAIAKGEAESPLVDKTHAVKLLGTMQGGYNIVSLVELLDDETLAAEVGEQLKHTLLMFDAFHDVEERAKAGNEVAKDIIRSWAEAEWFLSKPALEDKITLTVFKVPGETNTDDLSPAPDAWSRPDIPLHANAMLKNERDGIEPVVPGTTGPLKQIEEVRAKGHPVAYVGDVVGTGSSRKSATNSVLWFFGDDIPNVPNKRAGGFCFGGKIARSSSTPWKTPAPCPSKWTSRSSRWVMSSTSIPMRQGLSPRHRRGADHLRAQDPVAARRGARRRSHPADHRSRPDGQARESLGLEPSDVFRKPEQPAASNSGYTLAQKMVGKACGMEGVRQACTASPR